MTSLGLYIIDVTFFLATRGVDLNAFFMLCTAACFVLEALDLADTKAFG
jgi:hypothetical protein